MLAAPRVAVSLVVVLAFLVPLGIVAHGRSRPVQARLAAGTTAGVLTRLTTTADFNRGTHAGTRAGSGNLAMARAWTTVVRGGARYELSRWTSAWVSPGRSFTELVPSWRASTPPGAWIEVWLRVRDSRGRVTALKALGTWASHDNLVKRASAGAQADALVRVATDTVRANAGVSLTAWQVAVNLVRRPGAASPVVRSVAGVASRPPATLPATSTPLSHTAVALAVPSYSQMTHVGQNPQYGGGGEAWCSPTSVSMVLGYYHRLPSPASYAWVPSTYADRWVNHLARSTYDYRYRGTGNWPFNTAAAGGLLPDTFVTRLASLRMAERFIRAGIPLVVSIRFSRGQLTGAPISSTAGHLVVLRGFTSAGSPIVNDPAARTNATVRRVYQRGQFERAWLRSGGTAYVLRDAAHPLPARPTGVRSW